MIKSTEDKNTFDDIQDKYWAVTTNVRRYDHPVVKMFAEKRVNFIEKALNGWKPQNALDVGCGDGFGMSYMKKIIPVINGCDISQAMLDANPADPSLLKKASAYELPYPDKSFDLVYCWELLHHVDRPLDVVKEMHRVARKCVILCEPNTLNPAMFLFGLLVPIERGSLKFMPWYTKKLLLDAGLSDVQHYDVSYFTPNQTPLFLAKALSKLPYKVPYLGLYSVNIGYKD